MKVEYLVFGSVGVFLGIMAPIYGVATNWREPVGPVALIMCALLGLMVTYYLWFTGKKIGMRPEDDADGEIGQFEGDYGFFSPYSWQPLFLAGSAALCFLGLAVGWWLFIIGAALGLFALIGWTFEYWHGERAL
ncbi:MAG: cytochrome c oxidase subunit 4 [Nostocoides sp.]